LGQKWVENRFLNIKNSSFNFLATTITEI
jgi:hypothetical protein